MTILTTSDSEIYYEVHGSGPPLVLIHGASGTHLSWWQQIAEFRYSHTCLIYDLRGYGRSRALKEYDPGDGHAHYRDLSSLIEHVGFGHQKLSLIGASLGTAIALYYSAENKNSISKLILACGVGNVSTPLIQKSWEARIQKMNARYQEVGGKGTKLPDGIPPVLSSGEQERFAAAYHSYGPVGESMHRDFPALTFLYAEIMASSGGPPTPSTFPVFLTRQIFQEEADKMKFPILVVGGTDDPLFSTEELADLTKLFPNGKLELFKGTGHLAYYEKPRRFNDLILSFLRN